MNERFANIQIDEMRNLGIASIAEDFDIEFSSGRRLVYSRVNEQILIYIREYSLSFTPGRLRALRNRIGAIDEALNQRNVSENYNFLYKDHLGAGIYVSVDNNGVDLRRHWYSEERCEIVPAKNGIFLSALEWTSFKLKLSELLTTHPELVDAEECFHIGTMDCRECMPFWTL